MEIPSQDSREMGEALKVLRDDGMLIDERRWDDWLNLYAPEAQFWIPTWATDETLTDSHETQISHIFYGARAGLEDRVARLRTRRSPASNPLARTSHLIGNTAPVEDEPVAKGILRLRSSWTCHVHYPRSRESHPFFGRVDHDLRREGSRWVITRKKVVLLNDYIPAVLDFYCV